MVALVNAKKLEFVACDDDSHKMADFVAGKRRTAAPGMHTGDVAELWAQTL